VDEVPEDTPFHDPSTGVGQTTLATRTKSSTLGAFTAPATEKSPREMRESLLGTTSNDKAQIIALEKDEPKNLTEMQVSSSRPDMFAIQVGDRQFSLRRNSMKHSKMLMKQFYGPNWDPDMLPKTPDGCYILEGSGEMFNYLYDYMIEGHYPLFYDYHDGFDYQKYAKLLAAADYWDMEKLQTWIKKMKYEEVVKINISSGETLGPPKGTVQGGVFYEHHPKLSIKKIYICPKRIAVHKGHKEYCGKECDKFRKGADEYEEERSWKTLRVEKKVVIDFDLLKEERMDEK
jgi:hypothetical protein